MLVLLLLPLTSFWQIKELIDAATGAKFAVSNAPEEVWAIAEMLRPGQSDVHGSSL